jgi:hypothetical protein
MDLLERYLQAIRKYLPWTLSRARQQDILAELRANYESQLEERESDLGRKLTEGEMIDWLKQLGAPMQMAARYQPVQYLIGPRFFPMYFYVLRLALGWALAIYAVVTVTLFWAGAMGPHPQTVAEAIGEAILRVPGVLFTVAACVTLVFAVLEYLLTNHPGLLPEIEGISNDWSPTKLPPLDPSHEDDEPRHFAQAGVEAVFGFRYTRGKRSRYFAQACAEVIFGWFFLLWFVLVPKYPFLMFGPGVVYLRTGPFTLAPVWWTFYWILLALNCVQVVWNSVGLARGTWRERSRLKPVVYKLFSLAVFGVLLAAPNHDYLSLRHPAGDAAHYGAMLAGINRNAYLVFEILFLIVAIQWFWAIYLWIRDFRRATAATA